jgi:hypothetical protein
MTALVSTRLPALERRRQVLLRELKGIDRQVARLSKQLALLEPPACPQHQERRKAA